MRMTLSQDFSISGKPRIIIKLLKERMDKFGLQLEESKSHYYKMEPMLQGQSKRMENTQE